MAFEIPEHFNKQFTTNVELLLQQKMPVYADCIEMRSYQGEAAQVVKQFGQVEFTTKLARHQDTTFADIEHKQRWLFPEDYTLALPVDKEDELRMLNSPQSPYAEAMRAAWARKWNEVVRDAALGNAQTGKNGATVTAFDTTDQQITAGAAGLTISKLRQAREILLNNDIDPSEEMFLVYTPNQLTDLLESTEVTSSDYNTVKALVQGQVDTFMGFKFKLDTGLGVDGSGNRRCFAWVKSGIVGGTWNGLTTRIDERPDKEYLTQIFMAGTISAARTQEEKVVEILCAE